MKQMKKVVLAALFTLGVASTQAQDIAHINFEEIVAAMPEAKTMQTDIEKLGKTYEAEIKAATTALQAKYQRYESEQASKTPEENQQRALEVQQEQAKIQQLQGTAAQELQKKQAELLDPIVKKAQEAVKAYAKEKGIKYVLDQKSLVLAEGTDITGAIKTKLGVQ